MQVLFICDGNTCRSPMAAALAAQRMPGVIAASAGLGAAEGAPMAAPAVQALREAGVPVPAHTARQLTPAVAGAADLILTMNFRQAAAAERLLPDKKIMTLPAAAGTAGEVADPFGGDITEYRAIRDQLDRLLTQLAPRLPGLLRLRG
ncbi:MAG TPA: low molecular weight protein arginine phosphatase [bacterium]|nr:low molecular weight protein arginine phosphatase [bacterium]